MHRIRSKRELGPHITEYVIEAPDIGRAARAGQFVVLRLQDRGERIPLTIVEFVPDLSGITLVVQSLGKTTQEMEDCFHEGDAILDMVGPLGEPSEIERFGTVVCVGGGVGNAPLFPIARDLHEAGNYVIGVIGARSREYLIYKQKLGVVCDELHVMTDDGSCGERGFTSDKLTRLVEGEHGIDRVWAIGPPIMMKACCDVTRPHSIPTVVSLNPLMVDGTGMCGGCRVQVGGVTRFACVDGPEFDGHLVDFDGMMERLRFYADAEADALERYAEHPCPNRTESRS
jgi:ferredoxin--NADP+ reductase